MRRMICLVLGLLIARLLSPTESSAASQLSLAEKEAFLLHAKIVKKWHTPRGVANPWQATLDDGTLRHDGHIQTIDVTKASYQTPRGTEFNFRDTYKYNIVAYELAKLLELDMVPPAVERKVDGQNAAVSWWVDDKMFRRGGSHPPEPPAAELGQTDALGARLRRADLQHRPQPRQPGITKDWQIWMIDHTRAFRTQKTLQDPKSLARCDRKLLMRVRELDRGILKQRLDKYLTAAELDGMLARREKDCEVLRRRDRRQRRSRGPV